MSLCVIDLPTPIFREGRHPQAILPPPDLILIDFSANVNSRTLFVPFTVTPPRLVGPDQSSIFGPEALAAPYLKITTSSLPPGESCQLASGPSDE